MKGQVPMAFAVVKDASKTATRGARRRAREGHHGGGGPRDRRHRASRAVRFVTVLPKTRSGKLLRRSIQALCEGRDPGDLTTIEDPGR
jgi:propionyl-CoA synthetase